MIIRTVFVQLFTKFAVVIGNVGCKAGQTSRAFCSAGRQGRDAGHPPERSRPLSSTSTCPLAQGNQQSAAAL